MPKPNTVEKARKITLVAFDVAASAPSPRKRPIHTMLIDALSDCRTLASSVGSANMISVRPIGPCVRSLPPLRGAFAAAGAAAA